MYEVKFKCIVCNNPTIKKLPNKKSAINDFKEGKRKAYCSKACKKEEYLKSQKYINCNNCNKKIKYHPSVHDNKKWVCCSYKCRGEYMSQNSKELGLEEMALNMRKSLNEESYKKSNQTKIDKGYHINWKDKVTWKQWYRKCDRINRKLREKMIKNWDGYDYIDGEYIKPYLNLPTYHENYPTLDHIKPKSLLFQEGFTPEEATNENNLKFTKRKNNSKKGHK
jgi:hypothetical protein